MRFAAIDKALGVLPAASIANQQRNTWRLVRWIGLCAVAEVFGIAAAALWYGDINYWIGGPGQISAKPLMEIKFRLAFSI